MTAQDPGAQAGPPRERWFSLAARAGRQRIMRILLLSLFAAGAWYFLTTRAPRPLPLLVELGDSRSVVELDLVVRRGGRLLHRVDQRFARGAPPQLRVEVRAQPGPVDLEVVLVGAQGLSRKATGTVELSDDTPAIFRAE